MSAETAKGMRATLRRWFFDPIDASSLVVFRVIFGAAMLFEAVNYGIFLCLDCTYREPDFLFKYQYFEWIRLLPGPGLELVHLMLGIGGIGVMLGLYYRASAVLVVLCFGYIFLLDQALYLNHYYLALIFATILVFLPANRYWSLDARRRPEIRSATVPAWTRLWLGAQLEIVLLYAGIVKITADWLQLEPMRLWMNARSHDAAPVFQWLTQDWGIAIASYGAIALHLLGAPLLLFRRTRLAVFCIYAVFHLTNSLVFNIGIFPWITLGATLLLFDPDWPRQVLRWFQARGRALRWQALAQPVDMTRSTSVRVNVFLVAGILVWLGVQATFPLRHHFRPGNVTWNEDGHRFSWRMKLRSKRATAQFYVKYADGTILDIDNAEHLTRTQIRKMACIPDLIWQYAQFIESEYGRDDNEDLAVHVVSRCSLNTREAVPLVSELVDLTSIERRTPSREWLLPNTKPLPRYLF